MLLTQLVDVVPLHGSGSYMGYHFCGNFTGVPEAAGQKVHAPFPDSLSCCSLRPRLRWCGLPTDDIRGTGTQLFPISWAPRVPRFRVVPFG